MFSKRITLGSFGLLLSSFLLGCGVEVGDEEETIGSVEQPAHSWKKYHWARTANPFTLELGDNVNSTWDSYLATASGDWSESTILDTTIVAGSTSPKTCEPKSGMVQVCNKKYGDTGWLGIAQIWARGNHITMGVVKLNDSYFNSEKYNTPAWRNLVMCQEVGHTLGLGHNEEDFDTTNGTCMDYSNDPLPNQHPDSHDYSQLRRKYAHPDKIMTVSSATAAPSEMADVNLDAMEEWGELVEHHDHVDTFVRDLDELHVITTVMWAD